jgi:hypothetical protein
MFRSSGTLARGLSDIGQSLSCIPAQVGPAPDCSAMRHQSGVRVLACSGVRHGEFARIKDGDCNVGGNHVRVTLGKNKKDRYVSRPTARD